VFKMNPRKKPKFIRHGSKYLKKVKKKWRRGRGQDNKTRKKWKGKDSIPRPGYGAPRKTKGLHPSGFREVLVHNLNNLVKIDVKTEAVRIASGVGKRKKETIVKQAKKLKLKILNA